MNWIAYLVVTRIIVFLWMTFPLPEKINNIVFFKKLHECDLCSGFWAYSIASFLFKVNLTNVLGLNYIPFISEVLTGAVATFMVWVFVAGFKARFMEIHLN